jgi:hypothetical protein
MIKPDEVERHEPKKHKNIDEEDPMHEYMKKREEKRRRKEEKRKH